MKNFKTGIIIMVMIALTAVLFLPAQSIAQPVNDACKGLELTGGSCGGAAETDVNSVLTTVINIFSFVVGIVAVIMIIIGGLRYITSGGDTANTKAARDTILYAVIGLVIVAMAQIIVRFVLTRV